MNKKKLNTLSFIMAMIVKILLENSKIYNNLSLQRRVDLKNLQDPKDNWKSTDIKYSKWKPDSKTDPKKIALEEAKKHLVAKGIIKNNKPNWWINYDIGIIEVDGTKFIAYKKRVYKYKYHFDMDLQE